ncbi:MAG: hypothetical protein K2H64_09070 [Desulfovibrio sp.]|nr:hypothetical protein [Desulfovibrio sp.]
MQTEFIVIWGFRRSGAGLLASSLGLFGATLGSRASMPDEAGLEGAFEDAELVRLNEEMLNRLGFSWDTLCAIGEDHIAILIEAGYLDRAVAYLRSRAGDGPIIGLKDPQMTRLGLFWRKVFESIGTLPRSLVCFRDPRAVVQYLRRGALRKIFPGFFLDTDYGQLLWLGYTLASLIYTEKYPRVLINYDKLLENPEGILKQAATKLKLSYNDSGFDAFFDGYVSREKIASRFHYDDPDGIIARAAQLYVTLCDEKNLEFPPFEKTGSMWPHTPSEQIMTKILAQAVRENRGLQDYIAELTEQIQKLGHS